MLINLTDSEICLPYHIDSLDTPRVPRLIQDIRLPPCRKNRELFETESERMRYALLEEPEISVLYIISPSATLDAQASKRSDVISLVTDKQQRENYLQRYIAYHTVATHPWEYANTPVWKRLPYMRTADEQLEPFAWFYTNGTHPEQHLWIARLGHLYGDRYQFAEESSPYISFYHGKTLYCVSVHVPKPAAGKKFVREFKEYRLEDALGKAFAYVERDVAAANRKKKM